MKNLRTSKLAKKLLPIICTMLIITFTFIVSCPIFNKQVYAIVEKPDTINDLGYLGRSVNLLRDIDVNDKSDDLLATNHLKVILDDQDLSDFTVSKDPISSSLAQGFESTSFLSLAEKMGVDLDLKTNASTNFVIGSAKMNAGFSMGFNLSTSVTSETTYTIYNFQRCLDSWTLNWNNNGIRGNVATLVDNLDSTVYNALTNSLPQYTWSPEDFFEEYGTHIIVSYKRGGEYTYSSIKVNANIDVATKVKSGTEISGEASVSSFGAAGFSERLNFQNDLSMEARESVYTSTVFSRGSSEGQIDIDSACSINNWGNGVDDANAQVLSSGLTLIPIWELLSPVYAERKAELITYYNKQVVSKGNDLLNRFVYKTVNQSDLDFSSYDMIITSADQLYNIRNNLSGSYILACDIDLSTYDNWEPIGTLNNAFTGIFDGNGNTITNLNIIDFDDVAVGFFGANKGTIKNVNVSGVINLTNSPVEYLGGIVGYNSGTVYNCKSDVEINANVKFVNDGDNTYGNIDEWLKEDNWIGIFSNAEKTYSPSSIEQLPSKITDTTAVIDLRNLSESMNKTIILSQSTLGVKLIGDSSKIYRNLNIVLDDAAGREFPTRCILFENVNFTYDSSNGAIFYDDDENVVIVSLGEENSISPSDDLYNNVPQNKQEESLSAIVARGNLGILGNAKLTIIGPQGRYGSNGQDAVASNYGVNGYNGGNAINTVGLYINLNSETQLLIQGGAGGIGGNGGKGETGTKGSDSFFPFVSGGDGKKGKNGGHGGNGGDGGSALSSNTIIFNIYSGHVVICSGAGGNGGAGGAGGNGGVGGSGFWARNGKQGAQGDGGEGGEGGLWGATVDSEVINVFGDAKLILRDNGVGSGGNGGLGSTNGADGTIPEITVTKSARVVFYYKNCTYTLYVSNLIIGSELLLEGVGEKLVSIDENKGESDESSKQSIIKELFDYFNVGENDQFILGGTSVEIGEWAWENGMHFVYDYRSGKYVDYNNGIKGEEVATYWHNDEVNQEIGRTIVMYKNGDWDTLPKGTEVAGFITERSTKNLTESEVDIAVGGIAGVNEKTITSCWNNEAITIGFSMVDTCKVQVCGIVGNNRDDGRVELCYNSAAISKNGKIPDNILCELFEICEDGFNNCKFSCGCISDKCSETCTCLDMGKTSQCEDCVIKTEAEHLGVEYLWNERRVHVDSIDTVQFIKGDVLNNYVAHLSQESKVIEYGIKYDFSQIGMSGLRLSYCRSAYEIEDDKEDKVEYIFIPIQVVAVKTVAYEIDLTETVVQYHVGEEFRYPTIRQIMSDGSSNLFVASLNSIHDVPSTTTKGTQDVVVLIEDSMLTYQIKVIDKEVDPTSEQLNIQHRTTTAGGTVTLEFSFVNLLEIRTFMLYNFVYNKDCLKIIKYEFIQISDAKNSDDDEKRTTISHWDEEKEIATVAYNDNMDVNRVVFSLTFKVINDCEVGDYAVTCSAIVGYRGNDNKDYSIDVDTVNGNISVISTPRGDLDGDGIVNEDDVVYLLRYTLFPDMFPLNQSGDMDGDGVVNSDDAIYLLRYINISTTRYPLYW